MTASPIGSLNIGHVSGRAVRNRSCFMHCQWEQTTVDATAELLACSRNTLTMVCVWWDGRLYGLLSSEDTTAACFHQHAFAAVAVRLRHHWLERMSEPDFSGHQDTGQRQLGCSCLLICSIWQVRFVRLATTQGCWKLFHPIISESTCPMHGGSLGLI